MTIKTLMWIASSVLCFSIAAAQNRTGPDGNPVPVDVTDEPHHALILDNEFVRVFGVTVSGMQQTLWYQHPHDFIEVALSNSTVATGKLAGDSLNVNNELYPGYVRFRHGPTTFKIANKDSISSYRSITVEVKKSSDQPRSSYLNAQYFADYDTVPIAVESSKSFAQTLDRDTVRITDVQVLPKEEWKSHLSKLPYLVVAVSDVDLIDTSNGDDALEFKAPSGGVQWGPRSFTGTLKNVDDKPARFVIVEVK
jgi:hypothetical protein